MSDAPLRNSLPEKVLQFGTGILLRGLPDYFIDEANRTGIFLGSIVVIKSTPGSPADFEKEGFEIVAGFDIEPNRKREKQVAQPILQTDDLATFVRRHKVRMAILTVPAAVAQEVTNLLVNCGITGILNFAPLVLLVPEEVMVNNVNLAIELENLSYFIQD